MKIQWFKIGRGGKPPQWLLYTPTISLRAEEKPSLEYKKKRREKGKATSHASDKKKINYIKDTKNLISMRKEILVKNPQSLRENPILARENQLSQGNEKFGPPSSSTRRKRQTWVVLKRPSVMNKKDKSTRRRSETFKRRRHQTRQKMKEAR